MNIEIIAGGASFAPRRWSFPADATLSRSKSWCLSTALITAVKSRRNWAFSRGVSPGSSRLNPSSVLMDQLLCFPLPFTPAKGFSARRQYRPCFKATCFISCIVSWFWSALRFVVVKIGAISCWAGATSLCFVLLKIPSFHSSVSRSAINSAMRGLIEP